MSDTPITLLPRIGRRLVIADHEAGTCAEVRCEWCRFWRPATPRANGSVCSRLILTETLQLAPDRLLTGPDFGCSLFEPREVTP